MEGHSTLRAGLKQRFRRPGDREERKRPRSRPERLERVTGILGIGSLVTCAIAG